MKKIKGLSLFLKSAIFLLSISLFSCSNRDVVPRIDFTIDLSDPQYSTLNSTGAFLTINTALVAHAINGFIALSGSCTYDNNNNLQYNASTDLITCPSCNSSYTSDGRVYFGRASVQLYKYATTLNGNYLRVYTP